MPKKPDPMPLDYITAHSDTLFWQHVHMIPEHECWEWTGPTSGEPRHRPQVCTEGQEIGWHKYMAYRVAYALVYGREPDGQLHNKCGNQGCARLSHYALHKAASSGL